MQCGPYELEERLAAGAMGEVWRARLDDTVVAVKLVLLPDKKLTALFRFEVEAQARLQHPSILQVLDHGELDAPIANFAAGTPWLAMEYAAGGTLQSHMPSLNWTTTRTVLWTLLDALGYAHAQGVIHRDLKPLNVLLSTPESVAPGIRLADFGVARLQERADPFSGSAVGSVSTMSPEQVEGQSALIGPWTDLYAVGCMAWAMCTGTSPFRASNMRRMMIAHLRGKTVEWAPRWPVPAGTEAWIRRLIEVRPQDRYRCAAHAMEGLEALAGHGEQVPPALQQALARQSMAPKTGWERIVATALPITVPGWGRGLMPLRAWRTQGRKALRDGLWGILDAGPVPQVAVLTGPPGVGVSHMGRWLGRAAHRTGRAQVVSAWAVAGEPKGASLRRLLVELVGTRDAGEGELADAIRRNFALWGIDDPELAAVVAAAHGAQSQARLVKGVLRRLLLERCREQPLVIHMDDAHLAPEWLSFIDVTLQQSFAVPLRFVVGVGADTSSLPESWAQNPQVHRWTLGPMSNADMTKLVEQSLPVDFALRKELLSDASGLPGALRQRLLSLSVGDRLVPQATGFSLRHGDSLEQDEATIGDLDIQSFLATLAPQDGWRLMLAAAIGSEVAFSAWDAAEGVTGAGALGAAVARFRLQQELKRRGHIVEMENSWRWANEGIRKGIEASAIASGHWPAVHAAVAASLEGNDDQAVVLRRGWHRVAAGNLAAAFKDFERWFRREPVGRIDIVRGFRQVAIAHGDAAADRRFACFELSLNPDRMVVRAEALMRLAEGYNDGPVFRFTTALLWLREAALRDVDDAAVDGLWAACDSGDYLDTLTRLELLQFPGDAQVAQRSERLVWLRQSGVDSPTLDALTMRYAAEHMPPLEAVEMLDAASHRMLEHGMVGQAYHLRCMAVDYAVAGKQLILAKDLALAVIGLAELTDRGTPIPMINAAKIALLRREPMEARDWLDRARLQRGWQIYARVLDALEVGWACLVGDYALARLALSRLPNRVGLQELPEEVLAPAAVEVRPHDPELADALEAFVIQ